MRILMRWSFMRVWNEGRKYGMRFGKWKKAAVENRCGGVEIEDAG